MVDEWVIVEWLAAGRSHSFRIKAFNINRAHQWYYDIAADKNVHTVVPRAEFHT